jgi:ankyrin repeat protein
MSDGSDSDETPPAFVKLDDEDSDDDAAWEDPSGGVLTSILESCETGGDAAAFTSLLASLTVSVDTKGADGDTPLHVACLYGHADLVRSLLSADANVRATDKENGTPLHDACAGGYVDIVDAILRRLKETAEDEESFASAVNARDGDGETPLHLATRGDHAPVCALLLSQGADASVKSEAGLTARDYAVEGSALDEALRVAGAHAGAPRPKNV